MNRCYLGHIHEWVHWAHSHMGHTAGHIRGLHGAGHLLTQKAWRAFWNPRITGAHINAIGLGFHPRQAALKWLDSAWTMMHGGATLVLLLSCKADSDKLFPSLKADDTFVLVCISIRQTDIFLLPYLGLFLCPPPSRRLSSKQVISQQHLFRPTISLR